MQLDASLMKNLRIRHYPDPILKKAARPVEEITPEIEQLAERMIDLMVEANGIGLAAPQVGVSLRIIVVSVTGKRDDAEVLINPVLNNMHGTSELEEGCLSLPGIRAKVHRFSACSVAASDLDGNPFTMEAVDLGAIVLQHEVDHLDGILFVDRLNTIGQIACRKALKQLEKEQET